MKPPLKKDAVPVKAQQQDDAMPYR
ncbi:MAG: hypothetical protein RIR90_1883, partial [Bacteroidota bacterium]